MAVSINTLKQQIGVLATKNQSLATALNTATNTYNTALSNAKTMIANAENVLNAVVFSGTNWYNGPALFQTGSNLYPEGLTWSDGASAIIQEIPITFYGALYQPTSASGTSSPFTGYVGYNSTTSCLLDHLINDHSKDFLSDEFGNNPLSSSPTQFRTDYSVVYGDNVTPKVPLLWAYMYYTDASILSYLEKMNVAASTSSASSTIRNQVQQQLTDYNTLGPAVIAQYAKVKAQVTEGVNNYKAAVTAYTNTLTQLASGKVGGTSTTAGSDASKGNITPPPNTNVPPTFLSVTASDCVFNLPPIKSSIPLSSDSNGIYANYAGDDSSRRGRIWVAADSRQMFTQDPTTQSKPQFPSRSANYGFQFIWNPESYNVSVTINSDVTPSSNQYWATALPVFPSGETMAVSIVLDRTNDFAATALLTEAQETQNYAYTGVSSYRPYSELYGSIADIDNISTMVKDMQSRGTMADIEFLYKTINGDGWKNTVTGNTTSDIGFLMMTLVHIELGPTKYIGYLNSLNITHQKFTPTMVPLTTQLDMQFVVMATTQVVQQSGAGNSNTQSGTK
jgi:hypothetical protein